MMFNILRANDMIWGNFINSYMLAKKPIAMDLLYWNYDGTRLTKQLQSEYLRKMYLNNELAVNNKCNLGKYEIDLSNIECDCYFVAAKEDHIAPAKGVYNSAKILNKNKSNVRFVLSESGHVAGVINPANKNKYGFFINNNLDCNFELWQENAEYKNISWWNDVVDWLKERSGTKDVSKTDIDNIIAEKSIYKAPGQYVFIK